MIIYSLAAGGVSVGALFLAGFIPGILLGCCLLMVSVYMSVKHHYPKGSAVGLREALRTTKDAFFALGTAFIILFGTALGFSRRPNRRPSPACMPSSSRCSFTGSSR